jgi:hypothetical protein
MFHIVRIFVYRQFPALFVCLLPDTQENKFAVSRSLAILKSLFIVA